ncbi:MAG: hypothetical protein M1481_03650 [Candidatus Thermoplasmatota archaeon]|jgi:uncharacterized OB-fold protein|nr:hypothetical protein [Candidatus Thermoplasmatota archaeon]MCL5963392.1 hypothetical protein [Candidatus Thermoplasmatota archaeon]
MIQFYCTKCDFKSIVEHFHCPYCGSPIIGKEVDYTGRISNITTIYTVPEGFKAPVRIAIAVTSNNLRVLGNVPDDDSVKENDEVYITKKEGRFYFTPVHTKY